jgi:translocation and assembly module TamB
MRGQVVDWSALLESGWQGSILALRVSKENQGQLNLEQAVDVQFSTHKLNMEKGCLRGPKNGILCFGGQWSDQGPAGFQAEAQDISLDVIRLFVDMDWAFTHRLEGTFHWSQLPGKRASAQAQFALSPGELLFEDAGTDIETGPGVFQFRISEGDLHSGKLEIPIPGTGGIDVDFSIPHIADGADAQLIAHVVLDLKDISALGLLIPHIDAIAGELNADIKVGGTVSDPQLTGHATLVRGQLENFATGMQISDITLAGSVYQYDHTVMNGTFKAGEGRGRIKADVRFVDFLHPEIKLELNGDRLLLVNVPDLHLVANPDIEVEWKPGLLNLGGRIIVPAAQLSPRYLPSSSAVESADLVIISEQLELVPQPEPQEPPTRIEGEIEIELGDEVSLKLDRATANVKGKTRFIWDDDMIPMGDGAFEVSGEIYAYGQLLTISEGRVSFPRISAANPYLNIKAEREIYGNNQVKRAGVLISGTLKRPSMDTYTYPPTNKERALTLLITGNDFDYEQGVGAVEVGMYVAPRLYISYGIGLFEDQNVISARYDLKSGFGIKATSGQRETGVDISYTIER